ncbi:protein PLASTID TRANSCRIPTIONALLY ACTIVE 10 [Sesamum angolense]|uniref:Protein PLASTID TRANSCRIPTIONALLY ACTIVE 10 n=1 Tax=Sesamum angolense TaxID=2727404 RepID=A0AAE2BS66_9LAMI|nr:protein PLASTID TRANSCRIPTIONALLY ACTIVE 10 [Sesamum angolense]
MCLERYKVFLKQYHEWVDANRDQLEEESYKHDQDYYPGRRKRGKDYKEEMYELPFYYPGQICAGKVTAVHLYQGAFVDIGGVHDGWVPIKRNDWYWIRHHIKVGMHVIVEILAKRDPYRFRFPIELRFVNPNIDHLMSSCENEVKKVTLLRDCRRPPVPRKILESNGKRNLYYQITHTLIRSNIPKLKAIKVSVEKITDMIGVSKLSQSLVSDIATSHLALRSVAASSLMFNHLWQIHNAEQMILDDMEANPNKYKGKKLTELTDEEEFDEENSVEYGKAYYKKTLLPKMTLKISVKELELEAALAERQLHSKLRKEAEGRGEAYKITKLRRNEEMDEYDLIHWRRSFEEREALLRDISCRQALGLPLEEPGRYVDPSFFGKDQYDPDSPLYRYDYWGEPKNSEKSKQERMTDAHNKSIVGKGTVWYEMSYEDAIKQQMEREALGIKPKEYDEDDSETDGDDEDDDDEDFDYSILGSPSANVSNQPHVNGTESPRMSDEGIFED